MVATAAAYDAGPIAFRYPRGDGEGVDMPNNAQVLQIGKVSNIQIGAQVGLGRMPAVRKGKRMTMRTKPGEVH